MSEIVEMSDEMFLSILNEVDLSHNCGGSCSICHKIELMKRLKKATAEITRLKAELEAARGRWIPVSERLPSESGMCLVAIADVTRECYFNHEHRQFSIIQPFGVGVVAWQPLPAPYSKPEEQS